MDSKKELSKIRTDFLNGDYEHIEEDVKKALATGLDARDILENGSISSINEIGELFDKGERFVPDLLISGEIMQKGFDVLKPNISLDEYGKMQGKVMIGTVEGDVHDIGKNLVILMLSGGGFEVIDLGVDVSPWKFLEEARKNKPDIIAMSALINITMDSMSRTIDLFTTEGMRNDFKFLIGGAIIDEKFARECGADAYGDNAFQAVVKAKELMSGLKE